MKTAIRPFALATLAAAMLSGAIEAKAGGPFKRRAGQVVETTTCVNPANATAPSHMLGSMWGTPMVQIAGDFPTGHGYSPLGQYGVNNLNLYGPTSIYRAMSAPVRVYSRGYDGNVYETEATGFSTPNYPPGSPIIYPTPNASYYRPRRSTIDPIYTNVNMWIDQN
jgi:hypothetical protein